MKHIKRKTLLFVICASLLTSCTVIAGKEDSGEEYRPIQHGEPYPYEFYLDGEPKNNEMKFRGGLFVWKTGNSWHVRVASKKEWRRLYPPGPILNGSMMIENGLLIDIKTYNKGPRSSIAPRRNDIIFQFDLGEDRIEGFDFELRPLSIGYCVTVDIRVDGAPAPDLINLGRFMYTPNVLPLRICVR